MPRAERPRVYHAPKTKAYLRNWSFASARYHFRDATEAPDNRPPQRLERPRAQRRPGPEARPPIATALDSSPARIEIRGWLGQPAHARMWLKDEEEGSALLWRDRSLLPHGRQWFQAASSTHDEPRLVLHPARWRFDR